MSSNQQRANSGQGQSATSTTQKNNTSSSSSARAAAEEKGSSGSSTGIARPTKATILKAYGGKRNFMMSIGLKPYNPEDWEEANQILESFHQDDLEKWQESQGKNS